MFANIINNHLNLVYKIHSTCTIQHESRNDFQKSFDFGSKTTVILQISLTSILLSVWQSSCSKLLLGAL